MIQARHFWLHQLFFRYYFRYILRKDFRKTKIIGEYRDKGLPVLVIGNHISWWDGFFLYELNLRLFKRRFYLMMLEEQLKKIRFFRRLGAFSINPGSRSALKSVKYATEILSSSDNMLALFPEGELKSQYEQEILFRKGWFRILKFAPGPVQVVFMANVTDYFAHRKPTLFTYIEEYQYTGNFVFDKLCSDYNSFYQRTLNQQKQRS